MAANTSHVYAGIAASGVQGQRLHGPGGKLLSKHALQVLAVGGTLSGWSVTLEGSLDDANWTVLATHSSTIGSTVVIVDKPCLHVRVNAGTVTLGTASSITVIAASAE